MLNKPIAEVPGLFSFQSKFSELKSICRWPNPTQG